MTEQEKINIEHRLTEAEARAKSNTKRLDEHDEIIKRENELIISINTLAVEVKHMRDELNSAMLKIDKMEKKGGDKWDKFKWLVVAGIVTIILGYLAVSIGIK